MPRHPDELIIHEILHSYNLCPQRFTDDELNNKQTPDFKVYKDGQLVFFCEVKSIDNSPWPDFISIDNYEDNNIEPASRPDRTYDRIANKTYDASKQFESVNKSHNIPNVLAFVNHEKLSDFTDLVLAFDGHQASHNQVIWFVKSEIMVRLKRHTKHLPDLFIWINHDKAEPQFLFITQSPYYSDVCKLFGTSPDAVYPI